MQARVLPRWMHLKHGAYYLVRTEGGKARWTFLSRDREAALCEYARRTSGPAKGAFSELVDRALDDMKTSIAPSTYKNYRSCSKIAVEAFQGFKPAQVLPVDVAQLLDDNAHHPSMANLLRSFLKGVFTRAVRWGVVESNPVRDIKPFRTKKRTRYITADEFQAIRAAASPTMQCLMDVAYITGQRIGDVMGIRYADITDAGLYVEQDKTGGRILIAMTPDLAAAIQRARELHKSVKGLTLFHRRDGSRLSSTTMYGHWVRACKAAKVEDANFHDIRAASATDAKAQGIDSRALLGHTTESSHNRYLRSKEVPVAQPVPARKSKRNTE